MNQSGTERQGGQPDKEKLQIPVKRTNPKGNDHDQTQHIKPVGGTKILRMRIDNQNASPFFSRDIPSNRIATNWLVAAGQPNTPHSGKESKPSFQPYLLPLEMLISFAIISGIYEKIVSLFYEKLQFVKSIMGTKKQALHQKLCLIFSEHILFTLVRENQQISDFCTSLCRKPYCLSSTCCGEEPKNIMIDKNMDDLDGRNAKFVQNFFGFYRFC
ncbi:hypothetical protein ABH20_07090 [Geobacillus sp. T6]|uniref:hypothetical protein n=1 Tax=Geobacillus TaxID=129337 RepID=UPI000649F9C1|nr:MULTISPECIES: hypothetical protein [Geobacillus]ASS98438.1 hypothetical protein GT3921_04950 [Geobacillus thermocatenulatus]KLR74143.1 hypothetical protein ABH20_07090 [Geobacillus sp. T6]